MTPSSSPDADLRAEVARLREALAEVDRLALVISSAVNHSDRTNYPAVSAMLKQTRALTQGDRS